MALELAKVWVNVRASDEGMHRDLDRTESSLARRAMRMGSGLGAAIFSPMGAAIGAAGAAIGAGMLAKKGFELSAEAEQNAIAFETMLGSADKAKQMMTDLSTFAAKTPFDMPGIAKSAKVLLAFGVTQQELLPTLKALGDISAGTSKPLKELGVIFGQIKAKGRLMGQEMMQLREAGVNIGPILAKKFGVAESALEDMISKGQVSFKDVEAALFSMSAAGGQFSGLMEKQSQSVGGLWSTLVDTIGLTLTKIFAALAPLTKFFLNFAIKGASSILALVEGASETLTGWTQWIADWLTVITENWRVAWEYLKTIVALTMSEAFDFVRNIWINLPQVLSDVWQAVVRGFLSFSTWLGESVYTLVKTIGDLFWKIVEVFKAAFKAIEGLWLALFTGDSMSKAWERARKIMEDEMSEQFNISFRKLETDEGGRGAESAQTKELRQRRDALLAQLESGVDALAAGRAAQAGAAGGPVGPGAPSPAQVATLEAGRTGFGELGQKLQDMFLKKDDDKQSEMVDLLAAGNKKQDELIEVTKQNGIRPALMG